MKWETRRVAVTGGIVWGVLLLLVTIISVPSGYAATFLQVIASIYPGYNVSYVGSIVGFIYGFLDVFIGVYITVWVYKQLVKIK